MQFLTTVCIQSELVKMLKDSYIDEVSDLLRGGGGGVLNSATDKKKTHKKQTIKKKNHKHGNCKVNVLRIFSRYRYSEAKLYSHVTWSRGKSLSSKISSHGLTERFWERTWHPLSRSPPFMTTTWMTHSILAIFYIGLLYYQWWPSLKFFVVDTSIVSKKNTTRRSIAKGNTNCH